MGSIARKKLKELERKRPKIFNTLALDFLRPIKIRSNVLIIMGDAPGHLEELDQIIGLYPEADIMAVNRSWQKCKHKIKYLATMHTWEIGSNRVPKPKNVEIHALETNAITLNSKADFIWDVKPMGGTSSLFACIVGLCLGYWQIITVGVHLDSGPWIKGPVVKTWEEDWYPVLKDFVRGYSGLPKKLFGDIKSFSTNMADLTT